MAGEMISIDVDGAAMPAYAIRAETPGVPGVIVLQEIFGVDAGIKAIADLVATLGYGVVAPNIFHRTHPDLDAPHDAAGTALGRAAAGAVTVEGLRADLVAAVRYLRLECEAPRVATWGFCFGGSVAFLSATLEEIDAAVSFYGGQIATSPFPGLPPLLERTGDLVAPLFFAFGGSAAHVRGTTSRRSAGASRSMASITHSNSIRTRVTASSATVRRARPARATSGRRCAPSCSGTSALSRTGLRAHREIEAQPRE